MVTVLGKKNSLLSQFIAEIRDVNVQTDRMRFRKNLEHIGEIMAYEISKKLRWEKKEIITPLGEASASVLKEQPVIASILRAGVPFHTGMLNFFDKADNAFIAAYRRHYKDGSFNIKLDYLSSPDLNRRTLILCDPMLATGSSMVLTYKAMLAKGKPRHTHIATILASREGIDHVKTYLRADVHLWVCEIDEELTAQSYIVPGLGDAGDLAFGGKK